MLVYLATTWCGADELVGAVAGGFEGPSVAYVPDVVNGVRLSSALAQG